MLDWLFFLLGLIIGSFLNVCIYRLPQGESILYPASHCRSCQAPLSALDLIPVAGYIWLRGRCRYCGKPFSLRYAGVELFTGLLFLHAWQTLGLGPELLKILLFIAFLVTITFIDIDHQLILDKVLVCMLATGIVLNVYLGIPTVGNYLLSGLAAGGILLMLAFISRGGMGGGDIKLAAVLGVWLGWPYIALALLLTFLGGGVAGALLLLLKIKGRKDAIPFGPFLTAGAYVTAIYGNDWLFWYLALL